MAANLNTVIKMGVKQKLRRFNEVAWLLVPMLSMALATCNGNHGKSTGGASGGNGNGSASIAFGGVAVTIAASGGSRHDNQLLTSSSGRANTLSQIGGSNGGSSNAVGGSSAVEAPSASGAGGTAAQTSDPRATPYPLFVHDDAYGNIHLGAIAVDETHVYFAENGGRCCAGVSTAATERSCSENGVEHSWEPSWLWIGSMCIG